jgi:superfamily I DNA/RNA helicase
VLTQIGSEMRLEGVGRQGRVGPLGAADAVLCRTNARAIETVIHTLSSGRRAHLVGSIQDVLLFVRSARALQEKPPERANHPDLACFENWATVEQYVSEDPLGGDLALMVKLVNDFGATTIEFALKESSEEDSGVLTVSTAHKAKGRQWGAVRLADDFSMTRTLEDGTNEKRDVSPQELRLMYVGCTRAQSELDCEVIRNCSLRRIPLSTRMTRIRMKKPPCWDRLRARSSAINERRVKF